MGVLRFCSPKTCHVFEGMQFRNKGLVHAGEKTLLACKRLSSSLQDYQSRKGIVLLLPWLKASKSAVEKYEEMYIQHGMKPLVHQANLKDFLLPKSGMKSSLIVLDKLLELKSENDNLQLVIHSSSVGCYFYALMLWQIRHNPKIYGGISDSIIAQVCDSPVVGRLQEMAYGVGKMLSPKSNFLSQLCTRLCLMYFGMSQDTVVLYDELIDTFKYHSPSVPSLICSSENDPMRTPEAYDDLCVSWKKTSFVIEKLWKESKHAQHLRFHPTEYNQLIKELLEHSRK